MGDRVVFLDRDGTMVKDVPYCSKVEDLELLPGIPEAVKLLNDNGFKVIVVTNQSGIARGYLSENTLSQIHNKLKSELTKFGAHLDAIYYCPHHPDDNCGCRKPKAGLLLQASKDFNIDFEQSYIVGDQPMDITAGRSLGCRTVLLSEVNKPNCYPDFMAKTLLEASKWILSR